MSQANLHSGEQVMLNFNGAQLPTAVVLQPSTTSYRLSVSDPATGILLFTIGDDNLIDRNWNVIPCNPAWDVTEGTRHFVGVIPDPIEANIYYLITRGAPWGDDYAWSTLDMTLNNGLGGLTTQRNVPWFSGVIPNFHGLLSDLNGEAYWFVTHEPNTDNWRFHPILPQLGIGQPPVVIQHGPVFNQATANWGFLRIAANNQNILYGYNDGFSWRQDLCSIDPDQLQFGTPLTLDLPYTPCTDCGPSLSPEGTKAYQPGGISGVHDTIFVVQYDLTAGTPGDVLNSATRLDLDPMLWMNSAPFFRIETLSDGRLHLDPSTGDPSFVPDHNLYIQFPDTAGIVCGLNNQGYTVGGTFNGSFALPKLWWPVRNTIFDGINSSEGKELDGLSTMLVDEDNLRVGLIDGLRVDGCRLRATDVLGRSVIDHPWPKGAEHVMLNTSNWPAGIYILGLYTATNVLATTKWATP